MKHPTYILLDGKRRNMAYWLYKKVKPNGKSEFISDFDSRVYEAGLKEIIKQNKKRVID